MNLKRLWATTVTIFALSVFGPRSSGVWAQEQAACRAKPATSTPPPGDPRATPGFSARAVGWEWVRFFPTQQERIHMVPSALMCGSYSFADRELAWARSVSYHFQAERCVSWFW